jgi:hypothetical protein
MLRSHHQNAGQNHHIKIVDRCFENVAQFRYLGMTKTNQNLIQEGIMRRWNLGNACYQSVQNLLSSHLLSKNIKIRIYKTTILPVVRYSVKVLHEEQWHLLFLLSCIHLIKSTLIGDHYTLIPEVTYNIEVSLHSLMAEDCMQLSLCKVIILRILLQCELYILESHTEEQRDIMTFLWACF